MEQEEVPQGAAPMSMSGATTANGSTGTSPAAAQTQGTYLIILEHDRVCPNLNLSFGKFFESFKHNF